MPKNLPIVGIYPDNWQKSVNVNLPASLKSKTQVKNLPIVGIYPDNWQKSVNVNLPASLKSKTQVKNLPNVGIYPDNRQKSGSVNHPPPLFPAPKTLIFSIWALPVAKFDFIEGRAAFRTIYSMRGPTFIFSKKSVFSVNSRSLLVRPRVPLK